MKQATQRETTREKPRETAPETTRVTARETVPGTEQSGAPRDFAAPVAAAKRNDHAEVAILEPGGTEISRQEIAIGEVDVSPESDPAGASPAPGTYPPNIHTGTASQNNPSQNNPSQNNPFHNSAYQNSAYQNSAYQNSAYQNSERQPLAPQERDALILEHLPQVRLIARRIHDRLPESVALDDLISTGVVGLISAIDRFDSAHNVKLKTYAEYKIRGAILDSLRGLDWAPRQQRKRAKQIEAAIASAERRLHRTPSEEEIAHELGLKLEAYHEWLVEIRGLNLGSLENASADEDSRDLLKFVSDDEESWPSRLLERSELKRLLAEAISKMPDVEKTVLSLYYHEELTLREISKILKLHESRISQLKSQAILRLRAYMEKRWPTPRGL